MTTKSSITNNKKNEVNSYKELVETLDAGMEDIKQGRTHSHEEMKAHLEMKLGKECIFNTILT